MALMQIVIMPRVGEGTGLSSFVAEIQKFLETRGMPFHLHDMGTIVEGTAAELWELAAKLHELPFQRGVRRVYTIVNMDDRRDKKVALGDKVAAVRGKI